ncbi:MAG: hypothetical protein ACK2TX_08855 [Anaerolineales bacterium]
MAEKKKDPQTNGSSGFILGIIIGIGIGIALDNWAIGIGVGVALGAAFASGQRRRKDTGTKTEE